MKVEKFCTACNIKLDSNKYLKGRTVRKSCCNTKIRRNDNNTLVQNQQPKIDETNNKNNNRTLIYGFSFCGKFFLMNHVLHQKRDPFLIIIKSLSQYPNINAQTSDEIQHLEKSEKNSTIVFGDMLLSKQESNIDLFFTQGRHQSTNIFFISQSFYQILKKHHS